MKHRFVFAALPLIAGALAATAAAMPPADAWEIGPTIRGRNYSVGLPATPAPRGTGWALDFPEDADGGELHAVTTRIGSLASAREIVLRYRIEAAPGARFTAREQPDAPATVSVYIQRAGDNWSGRKRYQFYRWYAPTETIRTLAPGRFEMRVPLGRAPWTSVMGQYSNAETQAFADALANADRIGLAFGTSGRRSHGVVATAPARFVLESFTIR